MAVCVLTDDDKNYLVENAQHQSMSKMAAHLGFSHVTVRKHIYRLVEEGRIPREAIKTKRRWKDQDSEHLIAHYQRKPFYKIADDLGMSSKVVQVRFWQLAEKGLVNPHKRFYRINWTPAEKDRALKIIGAHGYGYKEVSQLMGRSRGGIQNKLRKMKVKKPVMRQKEGTFSFHQVCEIFGLCKPSKTVKKWLNQGLLRSYRRNNACDRSLYYIYPADLLEFLTQHRDCYDRAQMPVRLPNGQINTYREYAFSGNMLQGYITTKQVAVLLNAEVGTVRKWVLDGKLSAKKFPNTMGVHSRESFILEAEALKIKAYREDALKNCVKTLQAAKMLGVSEATCRNALRDGIMKAYDGKPGMLLGSDYLVHLNEIERVKAERERIRQEYLTTEQISKMVAVHYCTVQSWICDKIISGHRFRMPGLENHTYYVHQTEFERLKKMLTVSEKGNVTLWRNRKLNNARSMSQAA